MTKLWGPLGWMTLHSISVCYPEHPTLDDKNILDNFMSTFTRTITCPMCNDHFSKLFMLYKTNVPSWNNSKFDLFVAVCRMHNNVNMRLNKPIPSTVGECINVLRNATKYTSPLEFRSKYIDYLNREWRRSHSATITSVLSLQKINIEYWNIRDSGYTNLNFDLTVTTTSFPNQPAMNKIVFPRIKIRNIKWSPA